MVLANVCECVMLWSMTGHEPRRRAGRAALVAALVLAAGCASARDQAATDAPEIQAPDYQPVNLAAGSVILYEAQVRTANACHPDVGSPEQREACARKIAPPPVYRAEGMDCPIKGELAKIRMGTLDDMLEDTADYRRGITVRYVRERVGANMIWLMPLFPNNDRWSLPDGCDNLGSPYAVRDYFHVSGALSRACIQAGADEYSPEPCWANADLDRLVEDVHARGGKVMLDIALNHFGHNYLPYDVADVTTAVERLVRGEDPSRLWDFEATFDEALLHPELLDSPAALDALARRSPKDRATLDGLEARCPSLAGDALVRSFAAYRLALPHEREAFPCEAPLEVQVPGFYLGADRTNPSKRLGDNFTKGWPDVKFLYHREETLAHHWEFVRNREYLFRILNYWVSRGVDGFRFDHTTDYDGGMGSNEWKYLTTKVSFYARRRGQPAPIYLAEEFHEQEEMNKVMDVLTEGYAHDMTGRLGVVKDTHHVEAVLRNMDRFRGRAFVMTALETHDEQRLTVGTGFDAFTGAGFWGIGATTRSTPAIVMGQELGATYGIGFKRSSFVEARFVGSADPGLGGDALISFYGRTSRERLAPENRALLAPGRWFLRTQGGDVDTRIFAMAKYADGARPLFVFHNLWHQDVAQTYPIPGELAARAGMDDQARYRLLDVLSGAPASDCRPGAELRRGVSVTMPAYVRAQWLRLDPCE